MQRWPEANGEQRSVPYTDSSVLTDCSCSSAYKSNDLSAKLHLYEALVTEEHLILSGTRCLRDCHGFQLVLATDQHGGGVISLCGLWQALVRTTYRVCIQETEGMHKACRQKSRQHYDIPATSCLPFTSPDGKGYGTIPTVIWEPNIQFENVIPTTE